MVKILQSIDAVLYDIVLWMVLVPKTLLKTLASPSWISGYIQDELAKENADRYDAYMPPILLYLLSAVLPFFALLRLAGDEQLEVLVKFNTLAIESQMLVLVLFFTGAPLINSILILLSKHQTISRSSLRPIFQAQCMLFSVFYFLMLYSWFVENVSQSRLRAHVILIFASLWIWYGQTRVIIETLNKTKGRGTLLAFLYLNLSHIPIMVAFFILTKGNVPEHPFF